MSTEEQSAGRAAPVAPAPGTVGADPRRWWALVVTACTATFGGLLLGGRIGDLAGRKEVFIIALVGAALSRSPPSPTKPGRADHAATTCPAR